MRPEASPSARRRLIVTYSPTLHAKQSTGLTQTLTKAGRRLGELAERLARARPVPT